ncbi:MAG: minor capsid protein (endogenous virus) [Lactobacillus phage ViSo-2018b]|nr:MAG: minor capsid protein [Lactobacillus phage ViSo-2018b]
MSDLSVFSRMAQSTGSRSVRLQVLNQMHQDMEQYVPKGQDS